MPYVAHLLGVASLVLEEGGSEDMAIAALLHDAAEDQGGETMLAEIAAAFGAEVARWVRQASDSFTLPKPEWEARKRHHLAQIPAADREARLIMLADKVHNARSILADHARVGSGVWDRFSVPRERTRVVLRSVAGGLRARALAGALRHVERLREADEGAELNGSDGGVDSRWRARRRP